jgi:hypothetical protein
VSGGRRWAGEENHLHASPFALADLTYFHTTLTKHCSLEIFREEKHDGY